MTTTTIRNDSGVVARKKHRCCLCGEAINPGDIHRVGVVKDGRDFIEFRVHAECDRVTQIDKWDDIDWECNSDTALFRQRRNEIREGLNR